jgi:hypothetical protein
MMATLRELKDQNGRAALNQFYKGIRCKGRPLLFLDFDDVICLNKPYGGHDVIQSSSNAPADLWDRLWNPPSVNALRDILAKHSPSIVITTSWLRFMERDGFVSLFRRTGLETVAESLHEAWEAPQTHGSTRLAAVETWLCKHHAGQSFVVLDDVQSGTGLRGSRLDKAGCVVLCEADVGLQEQHLHVVDKAFS